MTEKEQLDELENLIPETSDLAYRWSVLAKDSGDRCCSIVAMLMQAVGSAVLSGHLSFEALEDLLHSIFSKADAERAAKKADEAGTPWDPEEPAESELAERIASKRFINGSTLVTEIPGGYRWLTPEEADEAAARYNFLPRMDRYLQEEISHYGEMSFHDREQYMEGVREAILRLLQEEREKLGKGGK